MALSILAFADELVKIAGLGDSRNQRRLDYFFSEKAGPDRWDKFLKGVQSQYFVDRLSENPNADPTLVQHAQALHDLSKGKTLGRVYSSRLPGRSYEVKETGDGLGCTCPDWKFSGTLNKGYKCKHIRAFEAGQVKAE